MISDLFAHPTIAKIAEFISANNQSKVMEPKEPEANFDEEISDILDSLKDDDDINNALERLIQL
jgi:hypothetical protein